MLTDTIFMKYTSTHGDPLNKGMALVACMTTSGCAREIKRPDMGNHDNNFALSYGQRPDGVLICLFLSYSYHGREGVMLVVGADEGAMVHPTAGGSLNRMLVTIWSTLGFIGNSRWGMPTTSSSSKW